MSEVKSWDTVFFVKALNQNIGIRVYYVVDYEKGEIHYQGHTKEFGDGPTLSWPRLFQQKVSGKRPLEYVRLSQPSVHLRCRRPEIS